MQAVADVAAGTEFAFAILTPGTLISTIFVGSMSTMWGLINSLQVIAVIPLIGADLPGNAKMIFELTSRIANFDNPVTEYAKYQMLKQLSKYQIGDSDN